MSLHIGAKPGDIAPSVLITGDPLRAQHYARTFLRKTLCYNKIRGMFGYTGVFQNVRVSIQGTGIGIPSTALYVHELIHGYGVKCIIRVGTCGAMQKSLQLGDLVIATEAFTDSAAVSHFLRYNTARRTAKRQNQPNSQPPKANGKLLTSARRSAKELGLSIQEGPLFSTDLFYSEDSSRYDKAKTRGVLGVDMETSMLYAMAKRYKVQALSILTVSDNLVTGEEASANEREQQADEMVRLALKVAETVSEDLNS